LTKYIEKRFCIRLHKMDGTAKLLAGASGMPTLGRFIKIPVAKDRVLVAKITAHPKAADDPWEATEV
jgi:hypothetical protein